MDSKNTSSLLEEKLRLLRTADGDTMLELGFEVVGGMG